MKAELMEVSRGSAINDTKYRKKVHVDGAVDNKKQIVRVMENARSFNVLKDSL
jgi:hypothetical protein